MKPKIGIISFVSGKKNPNDFSIGSAYIGAIIDNGGIPVIIPVTEHTEWSSEYVSLFDGLLVPGGEDINPLLYGEDSIPTVEYMNRTKDLFEIALIKEAMAQNKPIMGICRGHQLINVIMGGTLYQDIPSQISQQINHVQSTEIRSEPTHRINVEKNSVLYDAFKREIIEVNTYHHQSVKGIGKGLRVTARSADGVIEAMEAENKPIFSVQWHPEGMYTKYPEYSRLFKVFIERFQK